MVHGKRPKTKLKFAIPFILAASIMTATQGTFTKLASQTVNNDWIVCIRCLISSIILITWISLSKSTISIREIFKGREKKYLYIRAVAGTLGIYAYYYALRYISVANATVLFLTIPFFVPLVARVWRGVLISHRLYWGIFIAFIGVLLVLRPGIGIFHPAGIVALIGGMFGAIATVAIRLSHYDHPIERILGVYYFISFGIALAVLLISLPEISIPTSGISWVYMAGVGIFATAFTFCLSASMKYAPARLVSPFLFLSVGFAFIPDVLIWHGHFSILTILGMITIVLGSALMVILYPKDDLIIGSKRLKKRGSDDRKK